MKSTKHYWIFALFIIGIIFISGCSKVSKVEEINLQNCQGEECAEYCEQNPDECLVFCEENKEKCPKEVVAMFKTSKGNAVRENEGLPEEAGMYEMMKMMITGCPGGCRGPECEEVCSKNPELCAEWCQENPEICAGMMGGGFAQEIIKPPTTVITFAKTVNLNANGFTKEDITKAKALGVNMVTLWPPRKVQNDEMTFYPYVGAISQMINFAHQNALQVELRSSIGNEIVNDYDKYKSSAISYVAEFAKFAEQNKVYRIVPFGEIDNDMLNHCDKITEFAQELLAEMRKHYSGQIGVGVVGSWRDCGYTFEGYDYLTLSAYPQTQTGMDAWLTTQPEINLISVVDWAREVADRSNIQILHLGETGVFDSEDDRSLGTFNTVAVSKEKEAEFYEKLFNQVGSKVDGVSVFYNSKYDYIDINGDPAEEVVKEWYTSKLNWCYHDS